MRARTVRHPLRQLRHLRHPDNVFVTRVVRGALVVGATLAATAFGCGDGRSSGFGEGTSDQTSTDPSGDPGFGGNAGAVRLEPFNATVIIDTATNPPTPGSLTYKALAGTNDLTTASTFSVANASLGSFNGATFFSVDKLPDGTLGVSTDVTARTPRGDANGRLTVVQLRKTGEQRDFFFVVPFQEAPSPANDVLKFGTNIKQADVAFVMDTTGSMGDSIENLKNALQGTLMTQLQAAIPNVGLAVVDFRDFGDSHTVLVRQPITTNLSAAQGAVASMSANGGGDAYEASVAALHHTITGAANSGIPAHTPAPGTSGGVDFRPGSVPIVVHIHDNGWHDPSGAVSFADVKTAFVGANAKFVNIADNGGPENWADELSDATSSNVPASATGTCGACCTDYNGGARGATGPGGSCRLNFLSSGGGGVSSGVVKAIEAIAVGSIFDVKAIPSNDPKNVGVGGQPVDATKFIKALRAMDEGNAANGCPAAEAKDSDGDGVKDTFVAVKVGTPVCFEVVPQTNTIVPPEAIPQFFNAFVDVIGVQGNVLLDKRSVLFLVPPKGFGVK